MDLSQTRELMDNLPGLVLAIQKMLDRQEKDFGCFRVKKDSDFCSLYIPSFPSFKLYQNPRTNVYKGYWQTSELLPDIKDRSNKPQINVRKKQTSVEIKQQEVTESQNIKLVEKPQQSEITEPKIFKIIKKPQPKIANSKIIQTVPTENKTTESQNLKLAEKQRLEVINSKTIKLVKKQRIYEVIYKYNPCPEIHLVNQLIATCLKEKIIASIDSVPENEIMPLVLVSQDTKD